jgi:hypothetical protein
LPKRIITSPGDFRHPSGRLNQIAEARRDDAPESLSQGLNTLQQSIAELEGSVVTAVLKDAICPCQKSTTLPATRGAGLRRSPEVTHGCFPELTQAIHQL